MEPAVRAGLVVAVAGRREDALAILERTRVPDALLVALETDQFPTEVPLEATTVTLEADPDGSVLVSANGRHLGVDDLDIAATVAGARHLVSARGDLDAETVDRIGDLSRATAHTAAGDRLRLLLEDYLLRPADRSVVIDRLRRHAARDRRRDRDVDALFDSGHS